MPTVAEFKSMFSMPREPGTALSPGQHFEMEVPTGKRVLITDVYVDNMGQGSSTVSIQEQRLPNSFEIRYSFRTAAGHVTALNFTTGLKLGDEAPIAGTIRIANDGGSQAAVLPRINGVLVG